MMSKTSVLTCAWHCCMFMGRRMRLLGRYRGEFGIIDVVECLDNGARLYLEDGTYQSQATAEGYQPFPYVRLMAGILCPAENILLLGCGGGTLATMMVRAGKTVSVVDRNPLSFVIAERFFGMPTDVPRVCADFRDFLHECHIQFDGIAIDVSGPDFDMAAAFDVATCDLLRARLNHGGRIAMNVSAECDLDPTPDAIAMRLAGDTLRAWIFDQPGRGPRNAILACRPERGFRERDLLGTPVAADDEFWVCRRARRPRPLERQNFSSSY